MKKSRLVPFISFFLLALMLCKVTALHVYTHEDSITEIENCLQCELAIENQESEFSTPASFSFDTPKIVFYYKKVFYRNDNTALHTPLRFRQFGRPPPAIG